MIVRYDSLNRFETPLLTLCNPGSVRQSDGTLTNAVGILTDVSDMEGVLNFNETSELNFRVSLIRRDDEEEDAHAYAMYQSVKNRRLLFAENIGYFTIVNIEEDKSEDGVYKDVKAKSIDIEIAQKMIPYIENNTYRFSSTTGSKGLLETIVETLPLWTIGEVDESIAEKYRTFEDVDTSLNCLAFFLENMQDAYECIFVFDTTNRIINVYSQDNYVVETNIHITRDDLIKNLDIREDADDLYTAITVRGSDEAVTIGSINPLGANTIYDFTYYLSWMTPALSAKVREWQDIVAVQQVAYREKNLQYYTQLNRASEIQHEMDRLASQITMYKRCRANIIAESNTDIVASYNAAILDGGGSNADIIQISSDIAATLADIDELIATCQSNYDAASYSLTAVNYSVNSYKQQIEEVRGVYSLTSYFTESELEELNNYIFEGSYTDEYVTITDNMTYSERFEQMQTLYDRAVMRLARVSAPTQEFDVDTENFIFSKDFEEWSEQLETGCLINVELEQDDVALLFLSCITINYEDKSLKLTFGNRFNKFDNKSLFNDMLGDISKSANTLNYLKEVLYPIKNGGWNAMKEALNTSRSITMGAALASTNEEVVIDGSGYTGRRKVGDSYDPHQIKITGKQIVMTDDAWESCLVAIGELLLGENESVYGINAQAIIGDMLLGNSLRIIDNDGHELLTAIDNKISVSVSGHTQSLDERVTNLEIIPGQISAVIQEVNGIKENGVDSVTTSKSYTFNADGLTIGGSQNKITNQLTEEGMYVRRKEGVSSVDVLTADVNGVEAINLSSKQYLIVGENSRFEDYYDGNGVKNRTACFYIGE